MKRHLKWIIPLLVLLVVGALVARALLARKAEQAAAAPSARSTLALDLAPSDVVVARSVALGRTLDTDGRVTGAGLYASKIGGGVSNAMMLVPGPMGATGSTGAMGQRYSTS